MSYTYGTGLGGSAYEQTVPRKSDASIHLGRALLLLLYTLWVVLCLTLGAGLLRLFAPFIAFVPLSLWVLWFFTWRLTEIEYDYTLLSGQLTVHRVLGGRSRVRLCEVELRRIVAALSPEDPAAKTELERYGIRRVRRACSTRACTGGILLIYKNENEEHEALAVEPDEGALRLLRYYSGVMKARFGK